MRVSSKYKDYMKRITKNTFIAVNTYAVGCYMLSMIFNPNLMVFVFKGHIIINIVALLFTICVRIVYKCSKYFREYVDYAEDRRKPKIRVYNTEEQKEDNIKPIEKITSQVVKVETNIEELEKTVLYSKSSAAEDPLMKQLLALNEKANTEDN